MAKNEDMLVVTCVNTRRRKRYVVDSINDVCPACGEFHSYDNYTLYDQFGSVCMANLVTDGRKLERSV